MEFRYHSGALLQARADLAVLGVHRDFVEDPLFQAMDQALGRLLRKLARKRRFEGKEGQVLSVRTAEGQGALKVEHVVVLGVGERSGFQRASARDYAARAMSLAQQLGARNVVCAVPPAPADIDATDLVQLTAEGAALGAYRFDRYRSRDRRPSPVKRFTVTIDAGDGTRDAAQTRASRAALARAEAVAAAVCHARDLVNEPAASLTPTRLAAEAKALARKHELGIRVLGRKECERLDMGMFLSVARGSDEEPRLIHLIYKPAGKPRSRIALVGKGITFDSGGYSLKPPSAMEDMKIDMAGAATVIAAMGAIAAVGSPHEVHAVTACCENMVSGRAYKLGDVLRAMDGTTVEINNTDAEGRLTLGDAISYTRSKIRPDEILDFATLTGACMVALGAHTAGVMSNDDELAGRWLDAVARAGEDMWRLPLTRRLKDQLKSPIADMRNTGERYGGAITAGLFLEHFARDSKWLHVDLAGPAAASRARGCVPRGGTGFAVASIVEYLTR